MQTIIVHFIYYDIQLTKMNKQVKKNLGSKYTYKSRLLQWWNMLCKGPNKVPKNL